MQQLQVQVAKHVQQAFAAVQLLEEELVAVACDDSAALLVPHVVLPALRRKLEAQVGHHCSWLRSTITAVKALHCCVVLSFLIV